VQTVSWVPIGLGGALRRQGRRSSHCPTFRATPLRGCKSQTVRLGAAYSGRIRPDRP